MYIMPSVIVHVHFIFIYSCTYIMTCLYAMQVYITMQLCIIPKILIMVSLHNCPVFYIELLIL